MTKKNLDMDHCVNHKRPVDIYYKGMPYCMECFDKVTEEDFKKQKEIRIVKSGEMKK